MDAYLFAPPNAGDADFVSAFNKLVNARRLPFQYDVVPQVSQRPCTAFAAGLCVGCGLLLFKSILCSCACVTSCVCFAMISITLRRPPRFPRQPEVMVCNNL